eukprot:1218249-Alexandrium_andersonii.AAC.1
MRGKSAGRTSMLAKLFSRRGRVSVGAPVAPPWPTRSVSKGRPPSRPQQRGRRTDLTRVAPT